MPQQIQTPRKMFTPNSQFPLMNIKEMDNYIITRCWGSLMNVRGYGIYNSPMLFIFLATQLRHRLYLLFIKGLQRKKLNIQLRQATFQLRQIFSSLNLSLARAYTHYGFFKQVLKCQLVEYQYIMRDFKLQQVSVSVNINAIHVTSPSDQVHITR